MNIYGWEYSDLSKEIRDTNVAGLIELYKREDEKYSTKCGEYVTIKSSLTEDEVKEMEKECEFLHGCKLLVAMRLADELSK